MSTSKLAQAADQRPAPRPEAQEFARTGRINHRYSSEENRERFLKQTVFLMLFVATLIAGTVLLVS